MLEPTILYEDENFAAVNKPAGLLVHATRDKRHVTGNAKPEATLVDWLLEKYPEIQIAGDAPAERPGIVHRLDRDTSGVLVIARTQPYFEYLKKLFQTRDIAKTYLALVHGTVKNEQGTIDAPIGIKSGTTKRSVHSTKMQKEAVTDYRVLKRFTSNPLALPLSPTAVGAGGEAYSLLEVHPKTGRTHQIRVHLSSIGHPVVGDVLYGKVSGVRRQASRKKKEQKHNRNLLQPTTYNLPPSRMMLHALSIEFTAAPGERLKIEAPVPEDLKNLLDELKAGSG